MNSIFLGAVLIASTPAHFIFVDATSQLASDPAEDTKDTLDVEFADVDGDGDLDLFAVDGSASAAPFPNRLLINDGTGNFADESFARLPPIPANSTEVDFGDVDGDGDLDALVTNLGPNQLLINDGNGFFTEAPLPQATPPGPPGFAVPFPPFFVEVSAEGLFADLDNDGDLDIVIANENPFPFGPPGDVNRVLINDGTGTFAEGPGRIPFGIEQGAGYAIGDIDGDGDNDLIQIDIGENNVLINNGAGFFTDETAARLAGGGSFSSRKGVLGDVDGDGDLDLVVGNSRNEQNQIFLNDGLGVFTESGGALPPRLDTTTDVDLVDLDSDGDLDLYVTNVGDFVFGHGFLGDSNRILINDGNGFFVDATFPSGDERLGRSTNAEFGDVDGDGYVDLAIANSGGADQPDLPPPDGADRLYLLRPCDAYAATCVNTMLAGAAADVAALDTAAAPAGDMSGNAFVNAVHQAILAFRISRAEAAYAAGKTLLAGVRMNQVANRTDGDGSPPDWVISDAAARIYARICLALASL